MHYILNNNILQKVELRRPRTVRKKETRDRLTKFLGNMEESSSSDESNTEHTQQPPKKRRGDPTSSLDGIKHQLAPDAVRKGKAVRTVTAETPKASTKQKSPGAPKKPFNKLSTDYVERYASHLFVVSDYPGSSRKRMKKFLQQLTRY
jgi:hypothetical protein